MTKYGVLSDFHQVSPEIIDPAIEALKKEARKGRKIYTATGDYLEVTVEGEDVAKIIEDFGKHTEEEHGIEYSKESLMQVIMRKG